MNATNEILIRRAYADDDVEVRRLAVLDSAETAPAPPLLVAEIDGVLRVALSLADGSVVADPFVATADVIKLLRVRADAEARSVPAGRRLMARRLSFS
jgi:hypothetical protein